MARPAHPLRRAAALVAVAAAPILIGCGEDAAESDLAALAPPDAPLYVEGVVRPEGEQAESIEALAEAAGVSDAGGRVVSEVERLLAEEDAPFGYEEDVAPWIGRRSALFVRSFSTDEDPGMPDLAVLVEVEDVDAATSFLERLSEESPEPVEERGYGGHDYFYGDADGGFAAGVVDEVLVAGTESSFKVAIDANEGESLAEAPEFADRLELLGPDPVLTAFVDPSTVVDAAIAEGEISKDDAETISSVFAGPLSGPLAAGASISSNAISFDLVSPIDDEQAAAVEPELLAGLPADSWLALAVPALGDHIERGLDQLENSGLPGARSLTREFRRETGLELSEDVVEWLGDVRAFVSGAPPFGFSAGLAAGVSDPGGPRKALEQIQRRIGAEVPEVTIGPAPAEAAYGFTAGVPGLVGGAEAGVVEDELVAALGTGLDDVLTPEETLADDDEFAAATESLGEEFAAGLYVELAPLFDLAELGGASEDDDYQSAKPVLDQLAYVIAGSRVVDGLAVGRLTVGLKQD